MQITKTTIYRNQDRDNFFSNELSNTEHNANPTKSLIYIFSYKTKIHLQFYRLIYVIDRCNMVPSAKETLKQSTIDKEKHNFSNKSQKTNQN